MVQSKDGLLSETNISTVLFTSNANRDDAWIPSFLKSFSGKITVSPMAATVSTHQRSAHSRAVIFKVELKCGEMRMRVTLQSLPLPESIIEQNAESLLVESGTKDESNKYSGTKTCLALDVMVVCSLAPCFMSPLS